MTMNYTKRQNELIANDEKAMVAQSKWATMFWTGVWKHIVY